MLTLSPSSLLRSGLASKRTTNRLGPNSESLCDDMSPNCSSSAPSSLTDAANRSIVFVEPLVWCSTRKKLKSAKSCLAIAPVLVTLVVGNMAQDFHLENVNATGVTPSINDTVHLRPTSSPTRTGVTAPLDWIWFSRTMSGNSP